MVEPVRQGQAAVAEGRPFRRSDAAGEEAGRLYAALDLGTNNCRLLVAESRGRGFRVVDAFSRIVRLGEGVAATGVLSEAAMARTVEALKICRRKLVDRRVHRARLVATEACRAAGNGEEFLRRVKSETDLDLEIVTRETEARLAVNGCAGLVDRGGDGALLFDIGGGSSELVWIDLRMRPSRSGHGMSRSIRAWTSLPVGVVTIAEAFGGMDVGPEIYEAMVAEVAALLDRLPDAEALDRAVAAGRIHFLGTSGTVTTLAGVHLGLPRYDRRRVDGLWLADADVTAMVEKIRSMDYEERVASPCIGRDRADLVIAGCAILEAVRRRWRCPQLRVADRGLREGILAELIAADRRGDGGGRPRQEERR